MVKAIKFHKIKSIQLRNFLILLGAVAILFTGYIFLSGPASQEVPINNQNDNFADPLDNVDPGPAILERTQKQLNDTQIKNEAFEQQMKSLIEANKSMEEKLGSTEGKIDALEKQLVSNDQTQSARHVQQNETIQGSQEFQSDFLPPPSGTTMSQNEQGHNVSIREDSLSLSNTELQLEKRLPIKNPDTYVPAGTFAKAVMIGGADASAAVNSQTNPTPMIFRIISKGTLPNHKKSHLKDCVVTAAVVGDISSERGLIRLESLSCTFPNDEIVDQAVEGTIFGPEGKNGVRGRPVWRESALLQRAFAAGTLSGISDGISQTYTSNSISPEGTVQTVNSGKIFQYGVANGASKAMNKLADYNIQRAEQYHPVIQLSAGTVVDVVFLKGFFLDGKNHEEQENTTSQEMGTVPSLFSRPQASTNPNVLPLSLGAVKRIEEKSKELGLRVSQSDEA